MRYVLSERKFRDELLAQGFSSISAFAKEKAIHRNTLRTYLSGKKSVFSGVMQEICNALEVNALDIIELENTKESNSTELLNQLQLALRPIAETHPKLVFFVIGSRAYGKAQKYSDIDLGVSGGLAELKSFEFLTLKSMIDDAVDDISVKVDLVNMDQAPLWFLEEFDYQPIFLMGNKLSFNYCMGIINGVQKTAEN